MLAKLSCYTVNTSLLARVHSWLALYSGPKSLGTRLTLGIHTQPHNNFATLMFTQGANPVTDVTKRPITVAAHFKNDVCDLIELLENQVASYIHEVQEK